MPKASVIIRTKNEERWISHCLEMVFAQTGVTFEVILVDNNSDDYTLSLAKKFPLKRVVTIEEFKPGRALNLGIEGASGEIICCLSAHCVPVDEHWLFNLIKGFSDSSIVGIYGRQLPVSFSHPSDKRDLIWTFGIERRLQLKDYFFHNANSAIRKSSWDECQFDPFVTNIEDRIWAKSQIDLGYKLLYEPDAAVFHHHGVHQAGEEKRADSVISVVEQIDPHELNQIPASLRPENAKILSLVTMGSDVLADPLALKLAKRLVGILKRTKYINTTYLVATDSSLGVHFGLPILEINDREASEKNLGEILKEALLEVEGGGDYYEAVLYTNYDYCKHSPELLEKLIVDAQWGGFDSIFVGFREFYQTWTEKQGRLVTDDVCLDSRENKEPKYRALYGMGCLSSASLIRQGKLTGGKVGTVLTDDIEHTLRLREPGGRELIQKLIGSVFND